MRYRDKSLVRQEGWIYGSGPTLKLSRSVSGIVMLLASDGSAAQHSDRICSAQKSHWVALYELT